MIEIYFYVSSSYFIGAEVEKSISDISCIRLASLIVTYLSYSKCYALVTKVIVLSSNSIKARAVR